MKETLTYHLRLNIPSVIIVRLRMAVCIIFFAEKKNNRLQINVKVIWNMNDDLLTSLFVALVFSLAIVNYTFVSSMKRTNTHDMCFF